MIKKRELSILFLGFVVLAVVLIIMILFSQTILTGSFFQNIGEKIQKSKKSHFSVRWKGFMPAEPNYNTTFADYYITINNLPPVLNMNIALRIKNQEDKGYFFLIEPYENLPVGWSAKSLKIGYIDVDETKDLVYNVSRVNPESISNGELIESINFVVKAYYDSGFNNLYSKDNFTVTFHFIDVKSNAWDIIEYENFDDEKWSGWDFFYCRGGSVQGFFGISDEYYRSFPYSLKLKSEGAGRGYTKNFTVGWKEKVYLIFSLRADALFPKQILINDVKYFAPDIAPPSNKWHQFTIPLIIGKKNVVKIECLETGQQAYIDDIYVISK